VAFQEASAAGRAVMGERARQKTRKLRRLELVPLQVRPPKLLGMRGMDPCARRSPAPIGTSQNADYRKPEDRRSAEAAAIARRRA
jgi:hypothetical protein